MRNPIIGVILNKLQEAYNQGMCDNLSGEEYNLVNDKLSDIYDILAVKLDKVLTIEEASMYLNVTRQTLRNYVNEGKLHPKKHLGGVLEFKLSEIKEFINQSKH